jgi:hypothetical protein
MSNGTGYRAFPPEILHPSQAEVFSEEAFSKLGAQKMQEAPAACPGHLGTTVWYVERRGYVVELRIRGRPSIFISSICTFTPSHGMDMIDGLFAQDVEEYVLNKELGLTSARLDIFQDRSSVPVEEYLRARGVIK